MEIFHPFGVGEQVASLQEEIPAGGGQPHTLLDALEQLQPEVVFQLADLA